MKECCRAGKATDDNTTRCSRLACWMIKVTNTHAEYVIRIAFSWKKMVTRTCLSVTFYVHCLSCSSITDAVFYYFNIMLNNTFLRRFCCLHDTFMIAILGRKRQVTYLRTHSMVQSPSREANWFAASQEIPRISQNPKVHYRTHKRPPPVPILGQSNPVHIPTSHLLEVHPNIIHPSMARSPQWSLSLRFPHQDPIHPPLLTHTRHMPSPPHSS